MIDLLPAATTLFDLVALAVSLSLGFYVVTRSPRSRVSWLAALTLWCIALFFFHNALAINMPGSGLLRWLQPTMLLLPALWFHLSIECAEHARQRGADWPSGLRASAAVRRLAIILAYAVGVALILLSVLRFADPADPITAAAMHPRPGPAIPSTPSTAYVLVFSGLSLAILWQGYRHEGSEVRRRQFRPLVIATLLAALGGAYVTAGIALGSTSAAARRGLRRGRGAAGLCRSPAQRTGGRPRRRGGLALRVPVSRLVDSPGRPLAQMLYSRGHVFSFVTLVLVMVVAISVLMLHDGVRTALDRLFYRDQFRHLQANLRSLANEAGTGASLPQQLQAVLAWLCAALSIERGFVALAQDGAFVVRASQGAVPIDLIIPPWQLLGEEIVALAAPAATRRLARPGRTACTAWPG